jgi:hypothetical protein
MGADQSIMSVDEFSNRVMGTSVALLASQLDKDLTFAPVTSITDEVSHVLPFVVDPSDVENHPKSIDDYTDLYASYYDSNRRAAIDKYLTESVLDTAEHTHAFLKLLVTRLMPRTDGQHKVTNSTSSVRSSAMIRPTEPAHIAAPQAPVDHTPVSTPMTVALVSADPSDVNEHGDRRGQAKLEKRLKTMLSSIGNEPIMMQLRQQNINLMQDAMAANPEIPDHTEDEDPDLQDYHIHEGTTHE